MATSTMDSSSRLALGPAYQPANILLSTRDHTDIDNFFDFDAASGEQKQKQDEGYCTGGTDEETMEDITPDEFIETRGSDYFLQPSLPQAQEQSPAPETNFLGLNLPMDSPPSMISGSPDKQSMLGATRTSSLYDGYVAASSAEQCPYLAQGSYNEQEEQQQLIQKLQEYNAQFASMLPNNGQFHQSNQPAESSQTQQMLMNGQELQQRAMQLHNELTPGQFLQPCQRSESSQTQHMPATGQELQLLVMQLHNELTPRQFLQPRQLDESHHAQIIPMSGQYQGQQDTFPNTQASHGDISQPLVISAPNPPQEQPSTIKFKCWNDIHRDLARQLGISLEEVITWTYPVDFETKMTLIRDCHNAPQKAQNIVDNMARDMRQIRKGIDPEVEKRNRRARDASARARTYDRNPHKSR